MFRTTRRVASRCTRSHSVSALLQRFVTVGVLALLSVPTSTFAAETSLTISWSPEAARMIRDWRRTHGLPQAPEDGDPPRTRGLEEAAIQKALTLGGLSTQSVARARIAATHMGSYWNVAIHGPEGDFAIDVADAVLARASSRGMNALVRSE